MGKGKEYTNNYLSEIKSIYEELAQRPIERNCLRRTECCQFKLTGKVPQLTRGEAMLAAKAWKATGRKALPEKADGSCPMMAADGKCMIYESRPFGCRTHFCAAAGGPYERREVIDLIRRLEQVDHEMGGDGSHPLPKAVRAELSRS